MTVQVRTGVGSGKANGFTLLEVLVAITLLAIVLTAVAGAVRSIGDGVSAGTARADSLQAVAVAQDVFRRQVARAVPMVEGLGDAARYRFDGRADRLALLLVEPAAPGRGGFADAAFSVESHPGGQRLVYTQSQGEGTEPRRSVLLEGPFSLSFAYLDSGPGGDGRWTGRWDHRLRLPTLVRLEIGTPRGPLPRVVARLRADLDPACVQPETQGHCRYGATP